MKTQKEKKVLIRLSPEEIRGIYKDYTFDLESLDYDDDQTKLLSSFQSLSQPDRIILALYAEFQSQRKVATLLNVSRTTVVKQLNKIRKQILENV